MGRVRLPRVKRYKKQMTRFAAIDCKHDRSIIPFSSAKSMFNFDISSGALRKGYGVALHPHVPSCAERYWVYRFYSETTGGYVEQYIYQYYDGLLAFYNAEKQKEIYVSGVAFNPLDVLNYRLNSVDVLLLSCEGRKLITWNGRNLTEYQNSPSISSMAIHYERLFVTSRDEKTRVYFSKNLDPTQWEISEDGGGFIELMDERGYLNKVVSFGSYLYIFRDHGISRVSAYGDQTEFTVVNMFVTGGRIYPSSIATCGNCIMFLASDGLYVFNGYDCKRVLTNISPLIVPNDDCTAAYYNGKYYLACRMNFNDDKTVGCEDGAEFKTNGLIVYDPGSNEYSVSRGLNITFMNACSYNGEDYLMCCESAVGGVVKLGEGCFDECRPSYWESGLTDFDEPNKIKHLTEISFYDTDNASERDVYLGIYADGQWNTVHVTDKNQNAISLNLSGYRFAFSISTEYTGVNVTPLCVKYNTYER